jgi:hypothetical protein
LLTKNSELVTLAKLNEELDFIRENTDPEKLDSLKEIVDKALQIETELEKVEKITTRNTSIMELHPGVFADAEEPIAKELISNLSLPAALFDGWYYRNNVQGKKINWYLPAAILMKNSDIKQIYMENLVINKQSPLFFTIYTARTNEPDETYPVGGSTWYKCRKTYIVKEALTNDTQYAFRIKLDQSVKDVLESYDSLVVDLELDTFSSRINDSNGNSVDLPTDKILFFSVGSDSGTAAGNVEFILKNVIIQTLTGTKEFLFRNEDVYSSFSKIKLAAIYKTLYNVDILGPDSDFVPSSTS